LAAIWFAKKLLLHVVSSRVFDQFRYIAIPEFCIFFLKKNIMILGISAIIASCVLLASSAPHGYWPQWNGYNTYPQVTNYYPTSYQPTTTTTSSNAQPNYPAYSATNPNTWYNTGSIYGNMVPYNQPRFI
jgi:hypothetical protein